MSEFDDAAENRDPLDETDREGGEDDCLRDAAWQAYIALLRLPPAVRAKLQSQLAGLRDALATATNQTPEAMQTSAERLVAGIGGLL